MADVMNPGGNLTWTRVSIVGLQSGLPNGFVVKYNLTPDRKVSNLQLLKYSPTSSYPTSGL